LLLSAWTVAAPPVRSSIFRLPRKRPRNDREKVEKDVKRRGNPVATFPGPEDD
jgi:hypothetical protein